MVGQLAPHDRDAVGPHTVRAPDGTLCVGFGSSGVLGCVRGLVRLHEHFRSLLADIGADQRHCDDSRRVRPR